MSVFLNYLFTHLKSILPFTFFFHVMIVDHGISSILPICVGVCPNDNIHVSITCRYFLIFVCQPRGHDRVYYVTNTINVLLKEAVIPLFRAKYPATHSFTDIQKYIWSRCSKQQRNFNRGITISININISTLVEIFLPQLKYIYTISTLVEIFSPGGNWKE